MKKGVGPFAILLVMLVSILVIGGIYFFSSFERVNVSRRAMAEINIMDAINKVELARMALSQALEYSFYQAAYLTGLRGGFRSLGCVPYWRIYWVRNYPGFIPTDDLMLGIVNEYVGELNEDEVNIPTYTSSFISWNPDTRGVVITQASTQSKITLDRDNLHVEDESNLERNIDTNWARMYDLGKETFLGNDPIRNAIEDADNDMSTATTRICRTRDSRTDCKEIDLCDNPEMDGHYGIEGGCYYFYECSDDYPTLLCENSPQIRVDSLLEKYCYDWGDSFNDRIQSRIDSLDYQDDSNIRIDTTTTEIGYDLFSYEGVIETRLQSQEEADIEQACECKEHPKYDCNGGLSSDPWCGVCCKKCYNENDGQTYCCKKCEEIDGKTYGCALPEKGGIGKCTDLTDCIKWYRRYVKYESDYDYYGSAIASVQVSDISGKQYPVYDGSTAFRPFTLNFYVLSGNIYDPISGDLLNPSFEDKVLDPEASICGERVTYPPGPEPSPGIPSGFDLFWPTDYMVITSCYGTREDPFGEEGEEFHPAVDIRAYEDTGIYSATDGRVVSIVYDDVIYGNYIEIQSEIWGGTYTFRYSHLSEVTININDDVLRGYLIGEAGSTGYAVGAHLDFQIRDASGNALDPCLYLDPEPCAVCPI